MSRNLSARFVRDLVRGSGAENHLVLLELDHPEFAEPVRLVRDNAPVVHQGNTYQPFAFDRTAPSESAEGGVPIMSLRMQNVTLEIIREMNGLTGPVAVTTKDVLRATPDRIERVIAGVEMRQVSFDEMTITGQIVVAPVYEGAFSKNRMTPSLYPGLF